MIVCLEIINTPESLERKFHSYNQGQTFSKEGYKALFELLIKHYSAEWPYQLDVIDLGFRFQEDTAKEILGNYGMVSFEELSEETWAAELDNGNIIYKLF